MKIKASKYNAVVEQGEYLLLYNSVYGINSICKINTIRNPEFYEALVNAHEIEYDGSCEKLLLKNILVESDCDEEAYREYKKYSSLYNMGTNLIIMPTEQCNFRCTYCYEDFEKPTMTEEVVNNLKGYILRHIHQFQSLNIDWFGGEPLCAYDVIEEIMEYCKAVAKKAGIPVISTMTTNGYLLSPETVSKLIRLNVVGYQITMDGIGAVHDKQRMLCNGKGTYKQIRENLINIKEKIRTGVLKVCIRANLNSSSIKYIDELFDFLKEYFEDDSRFTLSLRYVRDLKGNGKTENVIDDDFEMLKVYELAADKIPRLLSSHFMDMLDSSGTCYAGKPKSTVIGSDGTLYKCTVHFKDDINIVGRLGNNRLEINENKVSRWIFEKVKRAECSSCWYRGACFDGTCPYSALIGSAGLTCPFEKIHISHILKFLDRQKMVEEMQ